MPHRNAVTWDQHTNMLVSGSNIAISMQEAVLSVLTQYNYMIVWTDVSSSDFHSHTHWCLQGGQLSSASQGSVQSAAEYGLWLATFWLKLPHLEHRRQVVYVVGPCMAHIQVLWYWIVSTQSLQVMYPEKKNQSPLLTLTSISLEQILPPLPPPPPRLWTGIANHPQKEKKIFIKNVMYHFMCDWIFAGFYSQWVWHGLVPSACTISVDSSPLPGRNCSAVLLPHW